MPSKIDDRMPHAIQRSLKDAALFAKEWATSPLRVAAIMPSSPRLADLITSEIDRDAAPIIELGPGTGVFTRALMSRGIPESKLVLIESGPLFAARLEWQFPEATVYQMDAARLWRLELPKVHQAGAIVSGLPLLSMSLRQVFGVLAGARRHLRPGGALYQFTYGGRCPVPRPVLERLGFVAHRIGHVRANLPPASVYRVELRPLSHPSAPVNGTGTHPS